MVRATTWISAALLALTPLAVAACAGERVFHESGEECWDGKDNDGDGPVDCDDTDCANITLCKKPPKKDSGSNGHKDTRPVTKDSYKPRLDQYKPKPDQYVAPVSSYGQPCTYKSGGPHLCADNKTRCVPGKKGGGFCTHACSGSANSCPTAPAGTTARCLYNYNGTDYCAFLCKYLGQPYKCPAGHGCYPISSYQAWCWP